MHVEEAVANGARYTAACTALGLTARTLQRWVHSPVDERHGPNRAPANKLTTAERSKLIEVATSPEFRDRSPKQIVPLLADRNIYLASESTFYRVLHDEDLQHSRSRARPASHRPREHVADGPWQVASWDITYLRSHTRGRFFSSTSSRMFGAARSSAGMSTSSSPKSSRRTSSTASASTRPTKILPAGCSIPTTAVR